MDNPRQLYAEWKAHDDAGFRRADELWSIVAAPAESVGGNRARDGAEVAAEANAAPGPSGRSFVLRHTKAGTAYGVRVGVLLLTHGQYAIERSRPNWNLEGMVDRFTTSLRTRAEALDNAKAVVPRVQWPKLDAMLVRWFKRPGTWKGTRKRIERCIRYMKLDEVAERQAMKALNTMALRSTWAF